VASPTVVAGEAHLDLVHSLAEETGVALSLVIAEPEGRNTAAAALAAALSSDPDEVLALLPSDHLIRDDAGFAAAVAAAAHHAREGAIVTFGIRPTRPETGYGYIEAGEPEGDALRVVCFKEKPDAEEALRLSTDGLHFWNSGIFVAFARTLVEEAERHCPEILEPVQHSLRPVEDSLLRLGAEFLDAPAEPFDIAIMEKTDRGLVLPLDVGWDDVGSFDALWAVSDKDDEGNATRGEVVLLDVAGSLVIAASRTVSVVGLDDVVVVETPDAVLVVPRDQSQRVREVARRTQAP
jgi:mannose-1-phosphate guanylyltransferase/mannose-6-phosphate isomerase